MREGLREAYRGRLSGAPDLLFATLLLVGLWGPQAAFAQPPEVNGVTFSDRQTLSWSAAPGAAGYHVYRGDAASLPGSYGSCDAGSVTGTSVTVADVPAAGSAFTYLVSGFDEGGEGTLGSGSGGSTRGPNQACVPARRIFAPQPNGTAIDGVADGSFPALGARTFAYPRILAFGGGVALHTGELIACVSEPGWPALPGATAASGDGVCLLTGSFPGAAVLSPDGAGTSPGGALVYRSQVDWDGPLGHNWFSPLFDHLRSGAGGDVVRCDGLGSCRTFSAGAGGFTSPDGEFGVLRVSGGGYALRRPHGTILRYHALDGSSLSGVLESIETRNGRRVSLLYDQQGLLVTVVDLLGRRYDLAYDADGRVTSLVDFDGREVVLTHDTAGDLTGIRSPVVTGTPNGNDFPAGKTTTLSYSAGAADPRLDHNLETVTDPTGQTWLQMTYSSAPDDLAGGLFFDRVVSQTIGGTNASGVPAGGTISFSYSALNPGSGSGFPDLERRLATVIDPDGNESEHHLNENGHELTTIVKTRGIRPGDPPSFRTDRRFDRDGLLQQVDYPAGESLRLSYDAAGADRYRQANLLEIRLVADPARGDGHGGVANDLVWTMTYEPLYNRVATLVDPRGNDPAYVPQNGGAWSADRYTTRFEFDYQEGDPATNGVNDYAATWGIDLTSATLGLGDLNGDGSVGQMHGGLVRREDPTVQLDPASNQAAVEGDTLQQVVTRWQHNGFGQVVRQIGPTGVETVYSYHPESDPDGDGAATPAPPDGRTLDTTTGGLLKDVQVGGLLIRRQTYDAIGRPASIIDGRGVLERRIWNALDQVVEIRRAAATADSAGPDGDPATGFGETGLTAFSYKKRFEYDAADRRVATETEDRGDTRGLGGWIRQEVTYDALDNVVRTTAFPAPGKSLSVDLRYDGGGRLVRRIEPAGNDSTLSYDERGLLYKVTRGASGPFGGTPATTRFDYDADGRLTRRTDPRGGLTDIEYDGLGRVSRTIDEVGGVEEFHYDPASRLVRDVIRGTIGGASPADRSGSGNVLLFDRRLAYDELNRLIRSDDLLGMPAGAVTLRPAELTEGDLTPGDGLVSELFEYDAASRQTFRSEDHGPERKWRTAYDALGRPVTLTAPDGSALNVTYDAAANVIELESVEIDSSTGLSDVFVETSFYDALGRRTMLVDNAGRTWRQEYDALDAVVTVTDPNGPPGGTIERRSAAHAGEIVPVNAHGNVTKRTRDGLGRLLTTTRVLTASGRGDGTTSPPPDTSNPYNPAGTIVETLSWDDDSRVTGLTDARGNLTKYSYDNLDRLTRTTLASDSFFDIYYDPDGLVSQRRDANGSVFDYTYDAAGRATQVAITPAAGIGGTTLQTFEYDGLHRVTRATDNNDPADPKDDSEIVRHFDLLGRLVEEEQKLPGRPSVRAVDHAWRGRDLRTALVYPDGRRVDYAYDAFGRLASATDAGSAGGNASFLFAGMKRLVSETAGSALATSIGYDSAARVSSISHTSGGTTLAGFSYEYDPSGRVTRESWDHDTSGGNKRGKKFAYDSALRLIQATEALFDAAGSPIGTPDDDELLTLDAEGNAPQIGRNGKDYGATPNNLEQYDEDQHGGGGFDDGVPDDFGDDLATPAADGRNFAHDANGARTRAGTLQLEYDAFGRLIRAISGGSVVGSYRYDALGRLAERTWTGASGIPQTRRLFHAAGAVVSVWDDTDVIHLQIARSLSGGPLWQLRDFSTTPPPAEHFLRDVAGTTVALATEAGAVLERYTYDGGGVPEFRDAANLPKRDAMGSYLEESEFGVAELLRGSLYLPELGSRGKDPNTDWGGGYFAGGRVYDPNTSREFGGPAASGGAASAARSGPALVTDAMGTGLPVGVPDLVLPLPLEPNGGEGPAGKAEWNPCIPDPCPPGSTCIRTGDYWGEGYECIGGPEDAGAIPAAPFLGGGGGPAAKGDDVFKVVDESAKDEGLDLAWGDPCVPNPCNPGDTCIPQGSGHLCVGGLLEAPTGEIKGSHVYADQGVPAPAVNYNSSRSNKPPAVNYNSSRKNKPPVGAHFGGGPGRGPVGAVNYNSSRSNEPPIGVHFGGGPGRGPVGAVNYNSSRSNEPPIGVHFGGGGGGGPANSVSWNSSRSTRDENRGKAQVTGISGGMGHIGAAQSGSASARTGHSGPDVGPPPASDKVCVPNSQGQVFCYEKLPPDTVPPIQLLPLEDVMLPGP